MLNAVKKQCGISTIEILVGLALSIIIIVAVLGIFTSSITGSQQVLATGKLQRDLQLLMDFIVRDVQRAGYWSTLSSTNTSSYSNTNPFLSDTNDVTTSSSCVTFTYDRFSTGTVSDTNQFGYRLSGGTIQYRPSGSTFSCAAATNAWNNLTDTNVITITQFATQLTTVTNMIENSTNATNYRTLTLTLSGYLNNATTNVKTITRTIKIYNNKYIP